MPWTFEGVENQPQVVSDKPQNQGKFTFEGVEPTDEKSIGLLGQATAGAASYLTWPADVLQAAVREQGLDVLKELENDTPEAREIVERLANKIPTQHGLEKYLEEKTGYRFEPKSALEKAARTGGEFFSPSGLLKGGAKQIAKTIGKRVAAAGAGAIAQEGLKEVGVHPALAGLAGVGVSSIPHIERTASKEAQALKEFTGKHGLRESQYMAQGRPKIPQAITERRGEKIIKDVESTSKSAIEKILHEDNPVGKLQKQGVNIDEYVNNILEKTKEKATKSPEKLSLNSVIESIDNKIEKIKSEAPSLSDVDKKYIEILEQKKADFTENPYISLEQHLNQYRKNNSDRTAFYKNPQMTHLQEAANNAYGFLNDELLKLAEGSSKKQGVREYLELLKAGNKLHKQKSDFLQASSILNPYLEEPTISNLNKVLGNKRNQKFLQRTLGKDSIGDINKIGKYSRQALDKLEENFVKHGKNWIDVGKNIGLASFLALASPSVAAAADLSIVGAYIKGAVMSNKTLRGDVLNLQKAAISGSKKAIRNASTKLNSDFRSEYGDPDGLVFEDQPG